MKNSISAWAPANISLIFKIYENKDPQKKGSYGLGFTIDQGVTVTVSKSDKTEILFNEKPINFPPVESVIGILLNSLNRHSRARFAARREGGNLLQRRTGAWIPEQVGDDVNNKKEIFDSFKVSITSSLPLGCGFGLSGASALAASYALNEFFKLHKSKLELAKIAHSAEVMNNTGLGDVVNQYFGGFLLKTKPSSEFMVEKISLTNIPIYCKVFSSLDTASVLLDRRKMQIIESEATNALHEIQNILQEGNIHAGKLFMIAKNFVEKSHLIASKEVENTLQEIVALGGHGSMILLGNAVVSDTFFPGSTEYKITSVGAHII